MSVKAISQLWYNIQTINYILKRISAIENLLENVGVLSAIVVEIAMNSPKVYSLAVSIISNLINHLDTTEKERLWLKIYVTNFPVCRILGICNYGCNE